VYDELPGSVYIRPTGSWWIAGNILISLTAFTQPPALSGVIL